jgi:hypothetical protein
MDDTTSYERPEYVDPSGDVGTVHIHNIYNIRPKPREQPQRAPPSSGFIASASSSDG